MKMRSYCLIVMMVVLGMITVGRSFSQSVPIGLNYQAVARDNYGKEMCDRDIDVKFSIISKSPLGELEYEELHSGVRTSKYGVFSLVIGKGTVTGGKSDNLGYIDWGSSNQYLKVEVRFDKNGPFTDMGTMQFLAVPYALYAEKSLYPGPPGPKGDPGDPATDDQTLSFDGNNLAISGGNVVSLAPLNIPHQLTIFGDTLSILGGNRITLPNQTQDLLLDVNNVLKITGNTTATPVNLSKFLDNTDSQQLTLSTSENTLSISGGNSIDISRYLQSLAFNTENNTLSISNGNSIDLTLLKNDADADPSNEIQDLVLTGNELSISGRSNPTKINMGAYLDNTDSQTLTYNQTDYTLSISNGGSVSLGGIIAFRAKKVTSETGLSFMTDYDFKTDTYDSDCYNDGNAYNVTTGVFTAPVAGLYSFNISFTATGSGDARALKIYLNGGLYETLNSAVSSNTSLSRSISMKLVAGDKVKIIVNTGTSTESGTGSFSGYRIY